SAGSATATITATPAVTGTQSTTFNVAANEYDTDLSDNALTVNVNVSAPPAPVVYSVNPSFGPTMGGTPVTISGANFVTGATVIFGYPGGPAATNVTVTPPNQITATTPAHAPGYVTVSVTNPDTQTGTLANAFNYQCPSITVGP